MTADATIDDQAFVLIDNWPGTYVPGVRPMDDFTATASGHDVTANTYYALGTKFQVYCPGNAGSAGFASFIYLALAATEANPTPAKRQPVSGVSASNCYHVTNDPDAALATTGMPLIGVMLSAMTAYVSGEVRYGWFWCGGVCPVDFVSDLGGTYVTNGDVAIGAMSCINPTTADQFAWGDARETTGATAHATIGMALSTD